MESGYVKKKPNPVEKANPFSVLTLMYMIPIFKRSFQKGGFTEDDLFEPLREHTSSLLGTRLGKIWKNERTRHPKAALHIAMFKMFGLQFTFIGILLLFSETMMVVVQPLAIGTLVLYFQGGEDHPSEAEAYVAAVVVICCVGARSFIVHPSMMGLTHIAMKMKVSCSALMYRKALRLSKPALERTTVGQIVNLLNDVNKFDQGFLLSHIVWIGPIQTAVGTYMLYRTIGVSAFFGVAFFLSIVPLQMILGQRTSVLRLRTALRTDQRIRLMNEIISGIQVIKMYTWEKPFAKLISFCRKREMRSIRQHRLILGTAYSFQNFVTRTAIFISILSFVLLGNTLTAQIAFTVTAVYTAINQIMTLLFSLSIAFLAEINVSLKRIQNFLEYGETETAQKLESSKDATDETKPQESPKVVLDKARAKWSQDATDYTLDDISIKITNNQLVAVVGPVGSGKSSLFHLILKELPITSGSICTEGTMSYSSQEPWLFTGSVRQNILFGEHYEEERYKNVVKACALEADFELLPFGDRTLVGERGKSLSGGQKARINLARCVYKKADVYLLDDPLSAVDAKVGKQLYEQCVRGFLRGKIRVLSTHQLQYLKNADAIVVLKKGRIEAEGKYCELQTRGLNFAALLQELGDEENENKSVEHPDEGDVKTEDEEAVPEEGKELMGQGVIKAQVYAEYFKSGGNWVTMGTLVLSFLLAQIAANGADYFLSFWVNRQQAANAEDTINRNVMVYVYSGLICATILLALAHCVYFFMFCLMASSHLHDFVFSKVINATMRFFDTNTSGRILNRFSKDMGTMDEYIPIVLLDVAEAGLVLIGTIALSSIVNPWLLLGSLSLITLFYWMRRVCLQTSRNTKRIETIKKTPLLDQMSATIQGLTTIRAFKAEDMLIKQFDRKQDDHSSSWFFFIASSRSFGFWLDLLCTIFMATVIFGLLTFKKDLYGGDMGLVITQYYGLIGTLQWGMRQWSELENQMTSVERVLEYSKIEGEPKRERAAADLPKDWPELGKIEFRRVSLRYGPDDPYVLNNLNFTIHPKEKIGVVGRTGAGKSSTIAALFQLYPVEGSILVDDVDTTNLPLDVVRSKISIIPQEPVLFSGTMRKNLDPFEEHTDATLWSALEQVELKDVIAALPAGLNTAVTEGGSNYSVGQRQLICLARAIVRSNKILVLDEATANVDLHTDALIQATIRRRFEDCTVLTVAHRLHTVMDSDRILVMSAGCVEEFGRPAELLRNRDSSLYKLVQTTGSATAKSLQQIAEQSYLKRKLR